uniref:Retrotransposon Copia-like N-terminal domain-containing protein n=1 Tax=Chenopodium quinoa TaxID=63459 RepID=A0A803L1N7_CHEQI
MLFDGKNFMIWSRNVKLALGAKNKKGFIKGKVAKPAVSHKDYTRWERNDYMVRCWIFISMTDQVAGGLSLSQTSKQLWDELTERYSKSNIPLLYQLKKDLGKLEQGDMSIGD